MDDLISRDFIKSLGGECIAARDSKTHELLPISSIDALPSARPEIIRCKDCKWFRRWIGTDIEFCDLTEATVFCDDFCSRAERWEE